MNAIWIKALIALVPVAMVLYGSIAFFRREKTAGGFLQVVGVGGLLVVVLTHLCEALGFFPQMGWGTRGKCGPLRRSGRCGHRRRAVSPRLSPARAEKPTVAWRLA